MLGAPSAYYLERGEPTELHGMASPTSQASRGEMTGADARLRGNGVGSQGRGTHKRATLSITYHRQAGPDLKESGRAARALMRHRKRGKCSYAHFLERARATELHASNADSNLGGRWPSPKALRCFRIL